MSEHKKVWVDKHGTLWDFEPSAYSVENHGPFTEAKVVPADDIVIERVELHEVDPNIAGTGGIAGGEFYEFGTVEHHEREARDHLAIAEYLRANPPVDEAEVERLADLIGPGIWTQVGNGGVMDIARRLYLAGVRAPEVTE